MAFTDIDTTGTSHTLKTGMDIVNTNFDTAQSILNNLFIDGEFKPDGTLVYPAGVSQNIYYNSDGTIDYFETTNLYLSKTWTLTYTYTSGNITLITANDGDVDGPWTRVLGYTSEGILNTIGDWS